MEALQIRHAKKQLVDSLSTCFGQLCRTVESLASLNRTRQLSLGLTRHVKKDLPLSHCQEPWSRLCFALRFRLSTPTSLMQS